MDKNQQYENNKNYYIGVNQETEKMLQEVSENRNNKPEHIVKELSALYKSRIENNKNVLEFLRPENDEDNNYRKRQLNEFGEKVRNVAPDNLDLYFHGTPIYGARDILKTGEISALVDRKGRQYASVDGVFAGQISVTDKDSIDLTLQGYSWLVANCLPAGCIFVLQQVKKLAEGACGIQIKPVNFHTNPEQLVAVITTPENIQNVSKWAKEGKINIPKICDFDGFIKDLEEKKEKANNSSTSAQDVIQHFGI